MRSAALLTLALLVAPALCAQRPKRSASSTPQTCNGNFVCPVINAASSSPTIPTSTGIAPLSDLSGSSCIYTSVVAAQCASTDTLGNPLGLQFSGSDFVYCYYIRADSTLYHCYYHQETGVPNFPGEYCPDSVLCAGNTALPRRRSNANSVSGLRRRLSPPRAQNMLRKRQYS